VHPKAFTLHLNMLAGTAKALRESADKLPIQQLVHEFRLAGGKFDELARVSLEDPQLALESHLENVRDISYNLASAYYVIYGRATRKESLSQNIRSICQAIDKVIGKLFRVEPVCAMFDVFVHSRKISEEAKAIVHITTVSAPQPPREVFAQPAPPPKASPTSARPALASKAPPTVPRQYRIERVSTGAKPQPAKPQPAKPKAPPPVLPKYKVERVAAAKPPRKAK